MTKPYSFLRVQQIFCFKFCNYFLDLQALFKLQNKLVKKRKKRKKNITSFWCFILFFVVFCFLDCPLQPPCTRCDAPCTLYTCIFTTLLSFFFLFFRFSFWKINKKLDRCLSHIQKRKRK